MVASKNEVRTSLINLFNTDRQDAPPSDNSLTESLNALAAMEQAFGYITEAASHARTYEQVYGNIVNAIPQVTNYDASAIFIYERESDALRFLGLCNLPDKWVNEVADSAMVIRNEKLSQYFKAERKTLTFEDFDKDPFSENLKNKPGAGGMAMYPLQLGLGNWGVLSLQKKAKTIWTPEETAWATLIGKHCELLLKGAQRIFSTRQSILEQNERAKDELKKELVETIERHTAPKQEKRSEEFKLTRRERDVLILVSQGASNKDIADELCLSESTAKKHLHSLYKKLGVKNRIQAAKYVKQYYRDDLFAAIYSSTNQSKTE